MNFILIYLVIFLSNIFQSTIAQSANCEYVVSNSGEYECYLTMINAEIHTQISGIHVTNKSDDDVTSIHRGYSSNSINFPSSVCEKFKNLKSIRLPSIGIQSIDENSFKACENLEYLDLDENEIKTLPKNIFENQLKLKILSMWENPIAIVPEEIFISLVNLEFCNIGNYTLKSASCEYIISDTGEYECYITLNDAQILTQISGRHLMNKTDNDVMNIYRGSSSNSVNFPSDICNKFKNLKSIRLPSIGIQKIDENSFKNCKNLEYLDLDENEITNLPKNVFAHQSKVKVLSLWDNPIKDLPKGFFDSLTNLELINYNVKTLKSASCEYIIGDNGEYECYLTTNDAEMFEQISGIHMMNKSDDDVTSIFRGSSSNSANFPSNVCKKFKNLKSIRLPSIGIQKIDENSFKACENLEHLDLDENEIKYLPKNVFSHQSKLKTLSMWDNPIEKIPDEIFNPLVSLEFFNIGNYTLKSASCEYIISDTGEYECYITLNDAQVLTQISGQHLMNKSDNDVMSIYRGSSSNSINFPSGVCSQFKNLKNIRLNSIGLENIEKNSFRSCENLEYLDLDENKIKNLPEKVFESQVKLKTLSLWENPITQLPKGFFDSLTNLEFLSFNDNTLPNLPIGIIRNLILLKELGLYEHSSFIKNQTYEGLNMSPNNDHLDRKIEEILTQVSNNEDATTAIQRKLLEMSNKIEILIENNQEMRTENMEMKEEIKSLNDKLHMFQNEKYSLKSEIENLKIKLQKIQTEKDEMKELIETMEGGYELLYQEIENIKSNMRF